MEEQDKFKAVITGIILIIFIILGLWYFFGLNTEKVYLKNSISIREKIGTGKFDSESVLQDAESLLEQAPNKIEKSRATHLLAGFLFNRNSPGDRERAFDLLHKVGQDNELPNLFRALAVAEIANLFSSVSDFEEMKVVVGEKEPYKTYLKNSNGDPRLAARRIFEYSNEIYPTALAHLEVDMINASRLMNGEHEPGVSDEELAQQIQTNVRDYVKKIDEKLNVDGKDVFLYPNARRSLMYMLAGISLGVSDRYLSNVEYDEIRYLMEKAISFEGEFAGQRVVALQADTARLYFAASLWSRFGDEKLAEVKSILEPVYQRTLGLEGDNMHIEFIKNAGGQDGTFLTTRLKEIAKSIPKFREYLKFYGWNV